MSGMDLFIKNQYAKEVLIFVGLASTLTLLIIIHNKEEEKKIEILSNEINEEVFNLLNDRYSNGDETDPEIDVDEYMNNYNKKKNISLNTVKKIKGKMSEMTKNEKSKIIQISLYIEGSLRSFWKLKDIKRYIE